MGPYKYSPINLEECSFRLVRVCRQGQGPIRCEIFHAWLDDKEDGVEYEALSYTWGAKESSHEIDVNGRAFQVTENLHLALQHIRRKEEDRILWIDAICIDQNNLDERGHQVRQMSSIYEKAIRVIIWLGKSTPFTQMAFGYMRRLQEQALDHACNNWRISDPRWQLLRSNAELTQGNALEDANPDVWNGFIDLLGRDWFKRAWIIQEVAQARAAEVMCGAGSVSARIFAVAPSSISMTGIPPHCQAILDIMPGPSRRFSWWAEKRDLRTLLYMFRESEASDPRDIIYALLGISSDGLSANFPTPNYRASIQNVISDTVAYLVRVHENPLSSFSLPWETLGGFLDAVPWLESEVLKWTAIKNRMDVPKMLFRTGQVEANTQDQYGSTLLQWAMREDRRKLIDILLDADEGEIKFQPQNEVEVQPRNKVEVRPENEQEAIVTQHHTASDIMYAGEGTPELLLFAVKEGNEEMVKWLLSTKTANVNTINSKDEDGLTPLAWAARNGHEIVAKLLLDTGKVRTDPKDQSWLMPLRWAARGGHTVLFKLLLDTGMFV